MSALKINVDISQLGLDDVAADAVRAARPAAQAGAQVIYDRVKLNVDAIKRHTGNLASSIYQAYSPEESSPGRPLYRISWNAKKAPHGHLVEWGHLQRYRVSYDPAARRFTTHKDQPLPQPKLVAARPFIRPAFAAQAVAERAIEERFFDELKKAGHVS